MQIRIEFFKIAYVLAIGESARLKQVHKVSLGKEYLNEDGRVIDACSICRFGIAKKYRQRYKEIESQFKENR